MLEVFRENGFGFLRFGHQQNFNLNLNYGKNKTSSRMDFEPDILDQGNIVVNGYFVIALKSL